MIKIKYFAWIKDITKSEHENLNYSNLKDINVGFRCMTNEAANKIKLKYRYNFAGPEIFALSIIHNLKIAEKNIIHHPRIGGRSELSGIKNLVFNSILMIKYMFDLKNDIKKSK